MDAEDVGAPDTSRTMTSAARKLLAFEIGDARTSAGVAAAAARACQKIADHFSRLVGDAGIHALFDRSLTLCAKAFPWLESGRRPARSSLTDMPTHEWAQLRGCLEAQEPKQAIETTVVLLATLLQLIARFIGDVLVLSLLAELWPDEFPKDEKGKK